MFFPNELYLLMMLPEPNVVEEGSHHQKTSVFFFIIKAIHGVHCFAFFYIEASNLNKIKSPRICN